MTATDDPNAGRDGISGQAHLALQDEATESSLKRPSGSNKRCTADPPAAVRLPSWRRGAIARADVSGRAPARSISILIYKIYKEGFVREMLQPVLKPDIPPVFDSIQIYHHPATVRSPPPPPPPSVAPSPTPLPPRNQGERRSSLGEEEESLRKLRRSVARICKSGH